MNNKTPFIKENFRWDGTYLTYFNSKRSAAVKASTGLSAEFVARFKYSRRDRASFQKFLIANFTVEEYFEALKTLAPTEILNTKGWVSPTLKKAREIDAAWRKAANDSILTVKYV